MRNSNKGKHVRYLFLFLIATMVLGSLRGAEGGARADADGRRVTLNFNQGWGFFRGDLAGAERESFDDSGFVEVTLPHVMRLEPKHNNTPGGVYKGVGWYRRHFPLDKAWRGKRLWLKFEGVMTDSEVFLNGERLHTRHGGYIGFALDITDKVRWEGENVLALRVSNADNPDTPPGKPDAGLDFHYYGGIYRDVTLEVCSTTHVTDALAAQEVAGGGVFVTYPQVSEQRATVHVKTHVRNDGTSAKTVRVAQLLKDASGAVVASVTSAPRALPPGQAWHVEQEMVVEQPRLWCVERPHLYRLVTQVTADGALVDEVETRAGIRTIAYKADGFYLNGKRLFLRGANRHQSYQNVGDAAPNALQRRDAAQMKRNGFNAVRATHYPQDPAFLDACDALGLLVIECQPGWQHFAKSQTFYDNTLRDTREMIRRDRNRPSIILWETSLNETDCPKAWAQAATRAAHEEYPGDQLFTAADYGYHGALYDVCYKVQDTRWSDDPAKWVDHDPKKPFLTREWGDFQRPSKALRKDGEAAMNTQVMTRQRYLNGNGYSDWGGLDASARIGGYFLWSWNDYTRGSTTFTLGSGTVDIDRHEKNGYYWLQSMQPPDNPEYGPMVHISTAYTARSALTIPVYSNCDSVRLFRNGTLVREISRKEAGAAVPNILAKGGSPVFRFTLPRFEPGVLRAEGVVKGAVVARHRVATPGQAVALEVEVRAEDAAPVADGSDLIPVYVKAVDAQGTVVPDFGGTLRLAVSGQGTLVGAKMPRVGVEAQTPENGIGFAFVRTSATPGAITITATANGLRKGSRTVVSRPSAERFVPLGKARGWAKGEEALEAAVPDAEAKPADPGKEIPTGAIVRLVASEGSVEGRGPELVRDGETDIGTGWLSRHPNVFPQTLEMTFAQPMTLRGSAIWWEKDSTKIAYDLEVKTVGGAWHPVLQGLEETWHDEEPEIFPSPQENVVALRVVLRGKTPAEADLGMAEWKVFGHATPTRGAASDR